jgi:hypothetical protein
MIAVPRSQWPSPTMTEWILRAEGYKLQIMDFGLTRIDLAFKKNPFVIDWRHLRLISLLLLPETLL